MPGPLPGPFCLGRFRYLHGSRGARPRQFFLVAMRLPAPEAPAPVAPHAAPVAAAAPTEPARLVSLDVFRGLTVMAMILVNNPGDWGHIYAPLEHAT